MMIVAGDNFLGKYEGMEQYSKPHSITPHPLYNKSTNNADIMLIKVRKAILHIELSKTSYDNDIWFRNVL